MNGLRNLTLPTVFQGKQMSSICHRIKRFGSGRLTLACVFSSLLLGLLGSIVCLFAGYLLDVYGLITLVFWAMALICVAGSLVDSYSLMWAYRVRRMSTAHGSARWAKASDLIRCGLMNRIRGSADYLQMLFLSQKRFGVAMYFFPQVSGFATLLCSARPVPVNQRLFSCP